MWLKNILICCNFSTKAKTFRTWIFCLARVFILSSIWYKAQFPFQYSTPSLSPIFICRFVYEISLWMRFFLLTHIVYVWSDPRNQLIIIIIYPISAARNVSATATAASVTAVTASFSLYISLSHSLSTSLSIFLCVSGNSIENSITQTVCLFIYLWLLVEGLIAAYGGHYHRYYYHHYCRVIAYCTGHFSCITNHIVIIRFSTDFSTQIFPISFKFYKHTSLLLFTNKIILKCHEDMMIHFKWSKLWLNSHWTQ